MPHWLLCVHFCPYQLNTPALTYTYWFTQLSPCSCLLTAEHTWPRLPVSTHTSPYLFPCTNYAYLSSTPDHACCGYTCSSRPSRVYVHFPLLSPLAHACPLLHIPVSISADFLLLCPWIPSGLSTQHPLGSCLGIARPPGWRGWSCTDNSTAQTVAQQRAAALLLTLSNLMFLAPIAISLHRSFLVEASVYFYTMFFSTVGLALTLSGTLGGEVRSACSSLHLTVLPRL